MKILLILLLSAYTAHLKGILVQTKSLLGIPDFVQFREHGNLLVDKSLLIRDVITNDNKFIAITRPRGWGKSMNLNMLSKFFGMELDRDGNPVPEERQINKKLFLGGDILFPFSNTSKNLDALKIAQFPEALEHQGQYIAMMLSLKAGGRDYPSIELGLQSCISSLFWNHRYLLNCTKNITEGYVGISDHRIQNFSKESSMDATSTTTSLQNHSGSSCNPNETMQLTEDISEQLNMKLLTKTEEQKFLRCLGARIGQQPSFEDLADSLRFLSELLYRYHRKKIFLLIDDYEVSFASHSLELSYSSKNIEILVKLFKEMYDSAFAEDSHIAKGVLMGSMRVSEVYIYVFAHQSNFSEYTIFDEEFSQYFGFTQQEVDDLLAKNPSNITSQEIAEWYKGFGYGGKSLYCPWSIAWCLKYDRADYYWVDYCTCSAYNRMWARDEMQPYLQKLFTGGSIVHRTFETIASFDIYKPEPIFMIDLLVFTGYLNFVNFEKCSKRIFVPNKELREYFKLAIEIWVTNKLNTTLEDIPRSLSSKLITGDEVIFKQTWQEVSINATSIDKFDATKMKLFYNGLMLLLMDELGSNPSMELVVRDSVTEHALVLLPKLNRSDGVIIIENRMAKNEKDLEPAALAALKQISSGPYDDIIANCTGIRTIFKIGIAFWLRKIEVKYETQLVKGAE